MCHASPPTAHLKGEEGVALWEQGDDHGKQFMVEVTSAPLSCGFWFPRLSDIRNASVLRLVLVLDLRWRFSEAHKWELAAVNKATVSWSCVGTFAYSIPPPPGSSEDCHPCLSSRLCDSK